MPNTKTLRPNRIKTILFLLLSIGFVSLTPITMEKNVAMSWGGAIFFGLGVIVFTVQLFPNASYLRLNEEGFEVRSMYRSHFTKWSDIEAFGCGYMGNRKAVMFDYSEQHTKQKVGKKIASIVSGAEGGLPDTYNMKAEKLAELMNEWKVNSENWENGI